MCIVRLRKPSRYGANVLSLMASDTDVTNFCVAVLSFTEVVVGYVLVDYTDASIERYLIIVVL